MPTKEQQLIINQLGKIYEDYLRELGLEVDHHYEFRSIIKTIETGDIVGTLHDSSMEPDWED